jgi:hypothetical protein
MKRRYTDAMRSTSLLVALALVILGSPSPVHACGGGLVSHGTVMDSQRLFVSVRGTQTDIVTQVAVPQASADFGVLIPLPGTPVIDPVPVSAAEMADLDRATAPRLYIASNEHGGGGIGCGGTASKSASPGAGGVIAGPQVEIGPVSAVVLTADDGAAVNRWLADNGFTLDAAGQALVGEYTAPGRTFVALRRAIDTDTGGPTSVGVHFTLPGDQRALPLRFARIGAASAVAFTVFVSAQDDGWGSAPAAPFVSLTLDDLDRSLIGSAGYRKAIESAVASKAGKAFVLERRASSRSILVPGSALAKLADPDATFIRLSTVIAVENLTTDVRLDASAHRVIPNDLTLPAGAAWVGGVLPLLLVARRLRGRARERPHNPTKAFAA